MHRSLRALSRALTVTCLMTPLATAQTTVCRAASDDSGHMPDIVKHALATEPAWQAVRDSLRIPPAASASDVAHLTKENFLGAIRTGETLRAPIAGGAKSVHLCHLGSIAQYTGRTLRVEPANGHIIGDAGAMRYWSRSYAPGWAPTV